MNSNMKNAPKLRKSLSSVDIFLISFTGMVGSGWLLGVLAGPAYAGPASIITWVVAGLFFIVLALVFSELGTMFPYTGSLVRFNEFSHGPVSNFYLGWAYTIGAIATPPVEAAALTSFISSYVPDLYNSSISLLTPLGVIFALALLGIFILIQYIGVNVFGKSNAVMTWFKMAAIILTIIMIAAFIFHPKNFFNMPHGFLPYGSSSIFAAMVPAGVIFSYEGFRQGLDYAGETKNPRKSVPIGMISAMLAAMATYILLQIVFIASINWSAAGVPPGDWSQLLTSTWSANPFYYAFNSTGVYFLVGFSIFLIIVAVISSASTLGVYVGSSARSLYGMNKIDYFPNIFGRLHPKFRTPWVSLLITFIIGALFLLPFPSWYALVGINSSFTVYAYLAAGITNTSLRKTAPEIHREFKTPFLGIMAPIGFVIASLLVYFSGWSIVSLLLLIVSGGLPLFLLSPYGRRTFSVSLKTAIVYSIIYWIIFIFIGVIYALSLLPFYMYFSIYAIVTILTPLSLYIISGKTAHRALKASIWVVSYNIILGIMSYYGSLGINYIIYPYDYIIFAILSLAIYFVATNTGYHTQKLKDYQAANGATDE
ncbi:MULTISPECIES: APC family permease [Acidiplasma]|jgi:amino acid transporter|uniref:Amino acid transporter n=1 Tax=Acidiplasma aeolicum TaxID=507754 RepID=A0A0Q0VLI0_9ARCH|nr:MULTISPECIES: APC family permease [Acidiplasma]KJE49873.1 amino acid transporter [Acidiplasma sp. MBA-1]KQB34299.1 amino acid transporter [Acidiplasma aeolicum]WMT55040.1 MAG: APC family permease [Acidiplasma sp.]